MRIFINENGTLSLADDKKPIGHT